MGYSPLIFSTVAPTPCKPGTEKAQGQKAKWRRLRYCERRDIVYGEVGLEFPGAESEYQLVEIECEGIREQSRTGVAW